MLACSAQLPTIASHTICTWFVQRSAVQHSAEAVTTALGRGAQRDAAPAALMRSLHCHKLTSRLQSCKWRQQIDMADVW